MFLIRSYGVQTYLAHKLTGILESQFEMKMTVGKVKLKKFKDFELSDILIPDQVGDTILYLPKLIVKLDEFDLIENKFDIGELIFNDAYVNLKKRKDSSAYSFEFLIEKFSTSEDDSDASFSLNIGSLSVENCRLIHANDNFLDTSQIFDYQNFKIDNLNLLFNNTTLYDEVVKSELKELSFYEKKGFELSNTSAGISVDSANIFLTNLMFSTPNSEVSSPNLSYHFTNQSKDSIINYRVNNLVAEMSLNDLQHFVDLPFYSPLLFSLNTTLKGSNNQLIFDDLTIDFGDKSKVASNFQISNLSSLDSMQLKFAVNQGFLLKKDFQSFKIKDDFGKLKPIVIPENLHILNEISFDIYGEGSQNDFISTFTISSNSGDVNGELSIGKDDKSQFVYTALIDANQLSGYLIAPDQDIANFNADLKLDGVNFDPEKIDLNLMGNLSQLTINNYSYDDLKIKGKLKNQYFNGYLRLIDQYLDFSFNGNVDISHLPMNFDFNLDLNYAHLQELGLINDKEEDEISFKLDLLGSYSNLNNYSGSLDLKNIDYWKNKTQYNFEDVNLTSQNNKLKNQVSLQSKFFSLDLEGKYKYDHLYRDALSYLAIFLPNITPESKVYFKEDEYIDVLVRFNDMSLLTEVFLPSLKIADATKINLSFSNYQHKADFSIVSDYVEFDSFKAVGLVLNTTNTLSFKDSTFKMNISVDSLKGLNGISAENLSINTLTKDNELTLDLDWSNIDTLDNGSIDLSVMFNSLDSINLLLEKCLISTSTIGTWRSNGEPHLLFSEDKIYIEPINIQNDKQKLSLKGVVGDNAEDQLFIDFSEFQLNNLISEYELSGVLNATVKLSSILSDLQFVTDIVVNQIEFNDYTIGDFHFSSFWDQFLNRFDIRGGLLNEDRVEEIKIENCFYYPSFEKENQLSGTIIFNAFNFDFLNPFLPNEIISELDGELSGNVALTGSWMEPNFNGRLNLNNGNIKMTEFNTSFSLYGPIDIKPDHIEIINATLKDQLNTKGQFSAFYDHDNFVDYSFNVITKFDEPLMIMNNNYEDNPLYYGDAYVTGFTTISYDSLNLLSIDVNVKTEEKTKLTIPLYGADEVELHDFISFKNKDSSSNEHNLNEEYSRDEFNLNIDMDITEEAELLLVFDETVGDVMKSKGTGSIRLNIDEFYDLSMFGTYTVSEGDYSFTLKDFINKKFNVEPGGQITWYGDPYNANLDLYANYPLKTSLSSIMPLTDRENWEHKSEVNVKIHLLNDLMNPDVGFDIELPKSSESAKTALKNLVSNEEEMNKQVFSLLILNQFIPNYQENTSLTETSTQLGESSTTEVLNLQLGNMVSSFTDQFEIGFKYAVGDTITDNQLSLAMSTQQFNDRLKISTNLGMSHPSVMSKTPTSFIGDVDVEYKISSRGNFRVHAYNESNEYDLSSQNQSQYTQGLGAFYKQSFDTTGELLCEIVNLFKPKKNRCKNCADPGLRRKDKEVN